MALPTTSPILLSILLIFATSFHVVRSDDHFDFGSVKKTHLHFYLHNILSGVNPTAIPVVVPPKVNVSTGFGGVVVADDPLTEGPHRASKPVGRGQGLYSFASQAYPASFVSFNFLFTEGAYKGSTIAIIGRYSSILKVREIPVVGGSGYFRGARGYLLAQTYSVNDAGDEIIEIDLYVH